MEKILFATDFSSNADKAFKFALHIAEKRKADLVMVHVFDIKTVWTYPYTNDPFEMKTQAMSSWERSLQEFFEHYDTEVKARYMAVEDPSVVKGILTAIERHKPQLVVVGTKGKSVLKEVLLGGTTKALVKRSPVPVLAVPQYAELKDYDKVLYASDFREVDLEAMKQMIDLLKPNQPDIRVLHISTDNDYKSVEKMEWFKEMIREKIGYENITFELMLSGNIFDTLNKYMSEDDYDMLVMLEKERSGIIDKLFHQGLVSKMEFRTWIPLLSFNEHFLSVSGKKDVKEHDIIEH
ncbi:universal stress protein [Lutimonas saemankumensis]|uniref:universal stress protein n=1 Tax=Lutimonas saemankumensis TaxID=483016 RepID=UPI001CD2E822|nr:universal stress protein [Lutimonas saemankumensis]MCA0931733.1 universal stress protein [Lutimonas saemankumensis]